jgi:hypothetical protein
LKRFIAGGACAALAVLAQVVETNPARIDIAGLPNPMIAGAATTLIATARDANGRVMTVQIDYSSNNTNVVRVNFWGEVTAVGLGNATITARSGRTSRALNVTVVPWRVEIDPPSASLLTGDQRRFSARVLDMHRQPITAANVQWQVLSPQGFGTQSLRVDTSGMLNATVEGRFTVQATVNTVRGFAPLEIAIKPAYKLTPVFSNAPIPGPHRFFSPVAPAVFNDNGQFAMVAHLNGWAQQALLWDNGAFYPLLASGETDWGLNRIRPNLTIGGVTSRGEVLISSFLALSLATRDEAWNVLPSNVWLGIAQNLTGFSVGRRAINELGEIAFGASSFQYAGSTTTLSGVFKVRGNRFTILWTTDQPLEGANVATTGAGSFFPIIDGRGVVYFVAGIVPNQGLYRADGSGVPQRLVGLGDLVDGVAITALGTPVVNENGDLAIAVTLQPLGNQSRSAILRWPSGGERQALPVTQGLSAVYYVEPAGKVLYYRSFGNLRGLYLWDGENAPSVFLEGGAAPGGGTINNMTMAGITAWGDIIAQVGTSRAGVAFVKPDGTEILKSGDWIDVPTTPFVSTNSTFLVGGSSLLLQLGPSLVELRSTGLEPVITLGDALPDNFVFAGAASARFVDTGANGIYFAVGTRLFRKSAEGYQLVTNLQSLGVNAGISTFAVNSQGHAAIAAPGAGLFFYDGAAVRRLLDQTSTPAPIGGFFRTWQQLAIDDYDRILGFADTTTNQSGIFLYDGGSFDLKLHRNNTRIRDTVITNTGNPRAVGRKFYYVLTGAGGFSYLVSLQDGDWEIEAGYGDPVPGSPNIVNGVIAFDVSSRGDLLYSVSSQGRNYRLVKSAGTVKPVHHNAMAVSGSYVNPQPVLALLEDGTGYIAGFDQAGRFLIIRADPL